MVINLFLGATLVRKRIFFSLLSSKTVLYPRIPEVPGLNRPSFRQAREKCKGDEVMLLYSDPR